MRSLRLRPSQREILLTSLIIVVSSIAAFAAKPDLGEVASALVFVLGITLVGAVAGLGPALVAAFAAFLLYNFFLVEPVLTLRLATGSDVAPLVVFNLCAVVAGVLAGRLKDRAEAADRSNLHLAGLLDASRRLQSAARLQDIAASVSVTARQRIGSPVRLFRVRDGALVAVNPDGPAETARPDAPGADADATLWQEAAAAAAAHDCVNASTRTGPLVAYRLDGSDGLVGIIVVEDSDGGHQPAFLSALATLTALAVERAGLSELIADSRAVARTEELKTALLSSVSHDFRTPLTTISASASSLIDYRDRLDPDTSLRLLAGIVEECDRLNRYTTNLLEMSRLESGQPLAPLQILGVSDMLSIVVQRVRTRAGRRSISRVRGGADLLVNADPALFELVLVNVLDNAILYSADGTRILITDEEDDGYCRITIADEGEGIPAEDLDRVFDRFYRIARVESVARGSGLGLAIAKGFVEALGGSIAAATPGIGDRGSRIVIRLPLAPQAGDTP